jgi:hypothetical protein
VSERTVVITSRRLRSAGLVGRTARASAATSFVVSWCPPSRRARPISASTASLSSLLQRREVGGAGDGGLGAYMGGQGARICDWIRPLLALPHVLPLDDCHGCDYERRRPTVRASRSRPHARADEIQAPRSTSAAYVLTAPSSTSPSDSATTFRRRHLRAFTLEALFIVRSLRTPVALSKLSRLAVPTHGLT